MLLQEVNPLDSLGQQLITAAILCVVSALTYWFTWMRAKKPAAIAVDKINKIAIEIEHIKNEIVTNGGSSMKDFVMKAYKEMKVCTLAVEGLQITVEDLKDQQKARWDWQFNESKEALFICNEIGDCVFVNKNLEKMFGMSRDELMGLGGLKAAASQDERQEVNDTWRYSVDNQIFFTSTYNIINQITGDKVKIEVKADPVFGTSGKLIAYFGRVKEVKEKLSSE